MIMITLSRGQIGYAAGLDTSVKSGLQILAPTWEMVMGVKNKTITEAEYIEDYKNSLDFYETRILRYLREMDTKHWTFLCYCRDEWFCHTYILIEWLVTKFPSEFTTTINCKNGRKIS
jgi:uncharacterized protein YeaO (DUF488 family)